MFAFQVTVMVLAIIFAIISIAIFIIFHTSLHMPRWLYRIGDIIVLICEPLTLIALVILMALVL